MLLLSGIYCSINSNLLLHFFTQMIYVDYNGAVTDNYVYSTTYKHGVDSSVSIISNDTVVSSANAILHATVFFAIHYDGINETLEFGDFSHPSLKFETTNLPPDTPKAIHITGIASVDVYTDALRHISYKNTKGMPTVGKRIIAIRLFDGITGNDISDNYIEVYVEIKNIPPVVRVNGNLHSYENRFYPRNAPVLAINPTDSLFQDDDSPAIQKATVTIRNALDGENESLQVTYATPESLTVPIIQEALELSIPFGMLASGEARDHISHSISVSNQGLVGDIDVILDIRHSWIGDLKLELEHADRRVLLVTSPGGPACYKDNLFSTTFDTESSDGVQLSVSKASPGLCQFESQGLFTTDESLQGFNGDPIEGEWILHITDLLSQEDNGRLVSWGLVIQPEEDHLVISSPAVVPVLTVGGKYSRHEEHTRTIEADGRIVDMAVHVTLGISFNSYHLHMPTMILKHPDGTMVTLSDGDDPLCAYGNYTHVIFDDRYSEYEDYKCQRLYNATDSIDQDLELQDFSSSGEDFSGSGEMELDLLTFFDLVNMNLTIPIKKNLIDIVPSVDNLSLLKGKRLNGEWSLAIQSDYYTESTLLGWSIKIKREANIDASYDKASNTLNLVGDDSPASYQTVLQTLHYENSLEWPDFSKTRLIETVLFDGTDYSNSSLPSSISLITIHHVVIDLDPFDISNADTPNFATSFTEHGSAVPIVDPNHALLSDPASQDGLYSLVITLNDYGNTDVEGVIVNTSMFADVVVDEYTKKISSDKLALVLNISAIGPQSISNFQTILRTALYFNNAEEFVGLSRKIEFVLMDRIHGNVFTSDTAITEVTLLVLDDPPVLILNIPTPEVPFVVDYTERQGEVLLTSKEGFTLYDNDDDTLSSITITITNAMDSVAEILSVNESVLDYTWIMAEYNSTTNTLVLSGVDTIENYTEVLSTITYENTDNSPGAPNPTTRVVTFTPNDGNMDGLPNITMISFTNVNDAPFGDLNGLSIAGKNTSVVYIEELDPVRLIAQNAVIFDVDNVTLEFITVQVLNPFDGELEELSVTDVSEFARDSTEDVVIINNYFPDVEYDFETSMLIISGLNSVYAYQQVLKTLTYANYADEPNPVTRIIEIIMNDGLLDSIPLYSYVAIELVNDSPDVNHQAASFHSDIIEDVLVDENFGFDVSEMDYLLHDDDVDSVPGIAIVLTDTTNGVWEYSLDSGISWEAMQYIISLEYALVLSASNDSETKIRFLPDNDFNGNATFSFVAWDATNDVIEGSYTSALSTSKIDPFSSDSLEATMIVLAINDAPVLLSIPLNFTTILEDDYSSHGDSILSLLEYASDVDIADYEKELLGIAIISAEQENGIWQYSDNGGNTWTSFEYGINFESALLLKSYPFEDNRVRFVPNKDYNGYNDITFLAWDLTFAGLIDNERQYIDVNITQPDDDSSGIFIGSASGSESGSGFFSGMGETPKSDYTNDTDNITTIDLMYPRYVNASLTDSIIGPLSVNSTTATIFIEPVNDSPTIVNGMSLDSIDEDIDVSFNHGTRVKDIINGFYRDVDANPMKGLAIVGVNDTFGEWQYNCKSPNDPWESFIGDIQYGEIFPPLPVTDKATLLLESCWIRFLPKVHFNTEFDYNHAPRPDSHIPYIIAHGWDNTGLTEGHSGTYANDASYANDSITNEYSYNTVKIPILVNTKNDIPILWLDGDLVSSYETTFYEDLESVAAVGDELLLVDYDHARLRKVIITIYGEFDESPYNETELDNFVENLIQDSSGYDSDTNDLQFLQDFVKSKDNPTYIEKYCAGLEERTERLLIDVTYTDLVTKITSFCPFTILIYPDHEKDIVDSDKAMFQKVLRTVQYNNSVQEPLEGERIVTFIVEDDFGQSIPVNTTIDVVLINDAPILDLNDYTPDINNFVTYYEGDSPLVLVNSSGLRLVDFDNEYLQYAFVILIEAPDTINETLDALTTGTNIIADYENYTLYLTGNDTVEAYAQVLSTVTYYNNYSGPGNPDQRDREVIFIVSDGEKENLPAQTTINFFGINDKPSIDVNGNAYGPNFTVTFREEEGPIIVTSSFTILVDEDNDTLAYVTATILNPLDGSLETLSVSNSLFEELANKDQSLSPNVTYNQTTFTLTITGLSSVIDYKRLVKTVMYNNDADEFVDSPREIEFIASDGLLESRPAYTIVRMLPINDSPYFNNVPIIVPHIYEDSVDNDGTSVYDIAFGLIEDHDIEYMSINKGIAVIEVDTENGYWQYKIQSSNIWSRIADNTTITHALLLNASDLTFIRFVPNADFNGNATLVFVAWDGVDGMPEGIQRVATSLSDTDPFSEDTRVLTVVVVPVNDAPVLNMTHTILFADILEDDVLERPSLGEDVSIFFSALVRDVDQDFEVHEFGVAIIEADQSNGYWQFSTDAGVIWNNMTVEPSPESAIVLGSKPIGHNRIRFAPLKDFNGFTSLKFKLWDRNVTYASGTEGIDTTITDLVTGTFSKDVGTAELIVEPVNDSPVLLPDPRLSAIDEDVNSVFGTYVYLIVSGLYIDVDVGIDTGTNFETPSKSNPINNLGIAVVEVDNRFGEWEYTCDDISNSNWELFKGGYVFGQLAPRLPNTQRATLLLGHCRIRFEPDENFNTELDSNGDPRPASDTPYLLIRGWDNTGDTEGLNKEIGIDTTSTPDDHTNPFSRDIQTVTIAVDSVNDPPQILIDGESTEYVSVYIEPLTPNRTVVPVSPLDPVSFTVFDVDNVRIRFVDVSFDLYDQNEESLLIDITGTALNYSITISETEYKLRLSPAMGDTANIEDYNTALRTLLYINSAEEPNPTTREIKFRVLDEGFFPSQFSTTELVIQLVNDPPEIDLNANINDTYNIVSYSEGQGPTLLVDTTLSLIDYDNVTLDHVLVTITNVLDGDNEFLLADHNYTNIEVSYQNGTLLLQGPANLSDFIDILLTVQYNNILSHPGNPSSTTRIIDIIANDGLDDSFTANVFLYFMAINNLPILDINGNGQQGFNFETVFVEEEGPVSAVALDTTLIDVDNETLEYIQVTLQNPLDGSYEKLWVENVTEYKYYPDDDNHYSVWEFKPTQYYNYTTGILTITGLETVYEYQQVLRTLKYNNIADEPNTQTRTLHFRVSDQVSVREGIFATIKIVSINDSPFVNESALLYHPLSYEDVTNEENIGWSLDDLASNWILDDDRDSIPGVAITGIDTMNGHWEYITNYIEDTFISGSGDVESGSTYDTNDTNLWISVPDNSSIQYAPVLRLDYSGTRIRFVPNEDFNGDVTISFVAWDATDGNEDGTIVNAMSQTDIDPFSFESVIITATIRPVNDAPLLDGVTVNMTNILEDEIDSEGNSISLFISGARDIDVFDDVLGIAVIHVDNRYGNWQFTINSGNNWDNVSDVSRTSALVLSSFPLETNRIRFVPNKDYNGYSSITFLSWDLTSVETNGMRNVDTTRYNSITGPFSTTSAQAVIQVDPVNNSPVVFEGMQLETLYEDIPVTENIGTSVSNIIKGSSYVDVDDLSEDGIAVVGVNKDNGLWQYTCPGWSEWKDFIGDFIYNIIVPPLPLPEKATMLLGDCRVRFLPNYLFNTYEDLNGNPRNESDIPYILIRGWDNTGITAGLSGHYGVDTTHNDDTHINELSSDTVKVLVYIESVNNPAELNITFAGDRKRYDVLFTEDDPYIRIVDPKAVSVIDIDNATFESITIELSNVYDSSDEWIDIDPVDDTIDLNDTLELLVVNVSGKLEMIRLIYEIHNETGVGVTTLTMVAYDSNSEVSKEGYEEALRHLVYINENTEPTNNTRLVIFHINDGVDITSNVFTYIEYKLLAENHPVLTTHLYEFSFTEGDQSPVPLVSDQLTLTDLDHNEFFLIRQAVISIQPIPVSVNERVSVSISNEYTVVQYYNETTGQLSIHGNAPVSVYEDILRTALYHNTIEEPLPGARNISIIVTDSHDLSSNIEYIIVTVEVINDRAPVITTASHPFYYQEHRVTSSPMEIDIHENLTVSDPDSGNLEQEWIEIEIINPLNGIEYEMVYAIENDQVMVNYTDDVLILQGPATVEEFQNVLSTLTYVNTAEEPILEERIITITGFDGLFYSEEENISIVIIAENDPPVVDLNGPAIDINYLTEFEEGGLPVAIANTSSLTITDNDNINLERITVELTNIFDIGKEILAVDDDALAKTSITSSYNKTNGVLSLTGNALLAEYLDVLKTVTYNNLESMPGNPNTTLRVIVTTAYDQQNSSIPAITYITFASVNDAPILDLNGNEAGDNYTTVFIEEGDFVILSDPNITLQDIDSQLLFQLRVRIVNCIDGDLENLAVLDNSLQLSITSATCELNITGSASVEEYQSLIGVIAYKNYADEPDFEDRIIEFIVNDNQDDSVPKYTIVSIQPVNDPPRLQISPPPGVYDASDFYLITNTNNSNTNSSNSSTTDPNSGSGDEDSLLSGSGMLSSGELEEMMTPVDPEPEMNTTTTDTKINITSAIHFAQYVENSPSVSIVEPNYVKIEDDDNVQIVGLEVMLNNELDEGYETIFFSESLLDTLVTDENVKLALKLNPLISPYISNGCPTGSDHFTLINITVTLSLEQMSYLIKSLHYCNTDNHPVGGDRNITFRIRDPLNDWSATETTIVNVVAVNDAPIFNTTISFENDITINEDHNITIPVLHLFYDFEEDLMGESITIVGLNPNFGEVTVNSSTGDILYYPALNDYGVRIISFVACDSMGTCSSPAQNLTINILSVNDVPYTIGNLTLEIIEDITSTINITIYFGDVEDDVAEDLSFPRASYSDSLLTELEAVIEDNGYGGLLTVTSRINSIGTNILEFEVCDSEGACIIVPLIITIIPVNDVPEIVVNYEPGETSFSTNEDTTVEMSVTFYDVESDIDTHIVPGVVDHGNGTVNVDIVDNSFLIVPDSNEVLHRRGNLRQDILVTYTPDSNFYGFDVITISATDSQGGYTEQEINVMVVYINDPPFFGITQVTTKEDSTLDIILPNDLDVTDPEDILHAGSFQIIQLPQYGTLSYAYNNTIIIEFPPTGTLTYIPKSEYYSTLEEPEYFVIQACDDDQVVPDNKLCTNATINVIVESTNDPPVVPVYAVDIDEEHSYIDNLVNKIVDVEDGTPPANRVTIIEPFASNGTVNYDTTTGIISYEPYKDYYGVDYIYFESCDSENSCNASGFITINVLDVNDPPVSQDFATIVREDIFELIDIHLYSSDLEDHEERLKISIVDPITGDYSSDDEVEIASGARLRVYQEHGIITYEPPENFVGYDSFRYAICDTCDIRRNSELGRASLNDYPQCFKQLEENGGSRIKPDENVDIACDESVVNITIINTEDVPIAKNLFGRTFQGVTLILNPLLDSRVEYTQDVFFYSSISALVYDLDDRQTVQALDSNYNLTEFGLRSTTDIDVMSLEVIETVGINGEALINISSEGVQYILYTPNEGFSGYEEFNYQICDIPVGGKPPRCSQAKIQVFVTKPGPEIISVTAIPEQNNGLYDDSKVSKEDRIAITFSEDTNMPPHHILNEIVSANDIDSIFEFPDKFIPPSLYENRYNGEWTSKNVFVITIEDEGYPQPENKIGEWRVKVNDIDDSLCGGIDANGNLVDPDDRCLLSADTFSIHSGSISPPIEGNWGLRLPELQTIVINSDGRVSTAQQVLYVESQISLFMSEPFSHYQLELYCMQDAHDILDYSQIGVGVKMSITGCENLLLNGESVKTRYQEEIAFSDTYFNISEFGVSGRNKRQVSSQVTEQPVASKITIELTEFESLSLTSLRDIADALNHTTIAQVISQLSGVDPSLYISYSDTLPDTGQFVGVFAEQIDSLTPKVTSITGDDPDCQHLGYGNGDTISIQFDRDTNEPRITTKADIDKVFVFEPPVGIDYTGYWESPSKAVIRVVQIEVANTNGPLSLEFTPNYLDNNTVFNESNSNLPTATKRHCYGINVCGANGPTTGICNQDEQSCRAYEPQSISTVYNGQERCEATSVSSNDWVWVLIAVAVAIVFVMFIVILYYCYRKNKTKRQKEEAMRVVERWHKTPKSKSSISDAASAPWAKPPDVLSMREKPDPFREEGVLRNLPEMVKRPPTAAEGENLPSLDQIPPTFVPRAGARIVPGLPSLPPLPLRDGGPRLSRDDSLPSLTPLVSIRA